jgi:hypothetical protein
MDTWTWLMIALGCWALASLLVGLVIGLLVHARDLAGTGGPAQRAHLASLAEPAERQLA